ncbi:hypothetical protein ACEPAF_10019 [Sanghuangporus sanghuang]|uniref:Transmembrane protein n=1 Tax=Sanghuangporus baumii TaxID=108892 RepID=A0A9Q5NA24_SANBA|nr:hypothetical protein A7U60_g401 [Sanghuangporus baumii]
MRVFSILILAAVAVVSFVPSAFAAPLVDAKAGAVAGAKVNTPIANANAGAVAGAKVHARLVGADVKAKAIAGVYARDDDKCTSVLTDLKVNLGVQIDLLNGLTKDTATKDNIQPILSKCVSIIADATVQIKALVGTGIVCDVQACASLLANILIALCGALAFVLGIVADVQVLLDIIVSVALGDCLCGLISAVISVVDGLLVALVPLVLSVVGTLVSLGLTVVGQLLTIC